MVSICLVGCHLTTGLLGWLMHANVYALIYFSAQRLRAGVTREMVREASALLESNRLHWIEHVGTRLRAMHGGARNLRMASDRPVVDRRQFIAAAEDALTSAGRPGGTEARKTSGSTGIPFHFPKSKEMTAWMDAAMWAVYRWHGIKPGLPHARFWGTPVATSKQIKTLLADRALHRHRIGAFSLASGNVSRHFNKLRRLQPFYGYGYPSLMRLFVELCREKNLDGHELGLRVVISTGEILPENMKEELATFFGCPEVEGEVLVTDLFSLLPAGVAGNRGYRRSADRLHPPRQWLPRHRAVVVFLSPLRQRTRSECRMLWSMV